MRVVGIRELKNRLSEYIRLVGAGERVLVTDHDRVVAELVAPRPGAAETGSDAVLAEAVRSGWLRPPLIAGGEAPPRLPAVPMDRLADDLRGDRADR